MTLKITAITEPGVLDKERLVMRAEADCDIGRYAVFRAKNSDDGKVHSGAVEAYWLPDKQVKTGDFVVLYSKNGKSSEKVNESGNTSYFYYWLRSAPIWDENHKPILVSTSSWKSAQTGA